jgi:glycosyltransferase involved in cell wall biosynthesis
MQEPVRITAIVPTYNREATVGRAVDSVLAQVYPAAEVIVVDDGSQDGTRERLQLYRERIRYIYQPNAGVSAARNRGASEARSEWIAFLDSDDCWLPGHLQRMAGAIRATQGAAALYFSDMRRGNEEDGPTLWSQCGFAIRTSFEFRRDAAEWVLLPIQPMMFQASVINRETYWKCGGLPPHMRTREDTLMFYKLGLLYPCCAVAGCGTVMMHDGGIRLTEVMDSTSMEFAHATVKLFTELRFTDTVRDRRLRSIITDELSNANFSLARASYHHRMYLGAVRALLRAALISPRAFRKCVFPSLRRRTRIGISPRPV